MYVGIFWIKSDVKDDMCVTKTGRIPVKRNLPTFVVVVMIGK